MFVFCEGEIQGRIMLWAHTEGAASSYHELFAKQAAGR